MRTMVDTINSKNYSVSVTNYSFVEYAFRYTGSVLRSSLERGRETKGVNCVLLRIVSHP